jgi:hypothetical protein
MRRESESNTLYLLTWGFQRPKVLPVFLSLAPFFLQGALFALLGRMQKVCSAAVASATAVEKLGQT